MATNSNKKQRYVPCVQDLTYMKHKYDLITLYAGDCIPYKPNVSNVKSYYNSWIFVLNIRTGDIRKKESVMSMYYPSMSLGFTIHFKPFLQMKASKPQSLRSQSTMTGFTVDLV